MDKKERPRLEIIENDILLDEWMRIYIAKQDKKMLALNKGKHANSGEIITFEG